MTGRAKRKPKSVKVMDHYFNVTAVFRHVLLNVSRCRNRCVLSYMGAKD